MSCAKKERFFVYRTNRKCDPILFVESKFDHVAYIVIL